MRPRKLVAGAALTAALALVALPGLAGSTPPSPRVPTDAAAFQTVNLDLATRMSRIGAPALDPLRRSANHLAGAEPLVEPPAEDGDPVPVARPAVRQPSVNAVSERRPPRYTLHGEATFYDHGTTAMRLPRGTVVIICGAGGCIERVVTDYGPVKPSRIVDLYRPDFFRICGCPWYAGVVDVTVHVY